MSAADEQRPPLHEATLRLLSLLATSRLEKDLLQQGIEALAAILQARYGAIGVVDDAGRLQQFVYTGIGPEEAARIGHLPEGRGLLNVPTTLRLSDMSRDPRSTGFPPHHPPMKTLLCVPFAHEGRDYGRVYLSEKFDGSDFSEEDERLLTHFSSVFGMMLAYHRSQTERERSAETLREISHALSAITGEAFFRELVQNLTRALGVSHAFVGEITDTSLRTVDTVAVCADGKLVDNFTYELPGTPCENIVGKELCFYASSVQRLFPDDYMLAEMGIESYIGSPVFDSAGKPLGILVLLDRKPLANPEHAQSILKICAARVGAELERLLAEESLRDSEERFRQLAENIREVFWMTDPSKDRMLYISPAYEEIWGRSCRSLYENPRNWLETIHPEERERVRQAALTKQISGKYNEEYRIARTDGTLRWIQDRAFPIRDKTGKIYRIAGVAEDITERKQAEEIQSSNLKALRRLHDIFANPKPFFGEKIQALLDMGCRRFGLPMGILARIENDRYEVIEIVDPNNAIAKGSVFPLGKTYCNVTLKTAGPVSFEHAANSDWKSHPCYQEFRLEAYLGITIHIGGKPYGTINFSSPEPRRLSFSDTDRELLKLMAQWIGSELANQQAEAEMRKLSSVIEQTADIVIITDPSGVIQYVNPAHQSITGYSPEEVIGNTPRLVKSGQHEQAFYEQLWETIQRGEVFRERFVNRKKDGSLYHEEKTITPLKDARGKIAYFVSTGKDITQRMAAEKTLRESNELLERIFDSTHFGVVYLDRNFNFIRVNQAYAKACGYAPDFFPGKNHFQLYPHEENEAIFRRVVRTGEPFTAIAKPFEYPDHPEWGVTYWDWTLHPLKDDAGNVEAVLFVLLDVTERRRTEEQLNALAYYDALTGLPNRQQLHDHLRWAMKEAANRERLVAILFLDLDRFKNINDTLGHDVGDALLKEVAARLRTCVRPGDVISRLGGDEFTIVLANVAHLDDVTRVAQKLLDHFLPPFRIAGRDLFVSPSIGITLYPFDGNNAEDLIKNADIAMYHAKELGRNNFQFYTPELNVRAARRLELETGLRQALERNEFVLHFQPLVKMDNGRIAGMEALLRWQHPEYGLIPPMEFIPLAEETGLIVPIGEWVLRAACARIKAWHDAGFPGMHVAVNLSSVQLQQKNFVDVVKRALRETGLEPRYLDLELTETLLMQDMEAAEVVLKELHALGVLFSLDDFGTGYSSLSYLKRFPIDFLKIDRSFVHDITHDRYGAGIVRAIIVMAHTLGIKVIAEGVETAGHFRFLRQQGCDISQGYYCSRPLATEAFTDLLRDWPHVQLGKCSLVKTARKSRKKRSHLKRRARK